ncbi:hypothetical protein EDB83DRAFT_2329440 [Lactarius deliciosus]|nr:hypothetical protein EDB83DRAFT_2329440 [Lactarius deliciosus]
MSAVLYSLLNLFLTRAMLLDEPFGVLSALQRILSPRADAQRARPQVSCTGLRSDARCVVPWMPVERRWGGDTRFGRQAFAIR